MNIECPHCHQSVQSDQPARDAIAQIEAGITKLSAMLDDLKPKESVPERVGRIVAEYYGIDKCLLFSRARVRRVMLARQIAFWVMHKLGCSPAELARHWSFKSHAIAHNIHVADKLFETYPALALQRDTLLSRCTP